MEIRVKREKAIQNAIPSKIYLDGDFFAYGLENSDYSIPAGRYAVSAKRSEKFGANKLYLTVPDRSGIMFHGGNTANDTRGCVLVGARREGAAIAGDKSNELYTAVDSAANAGGGVVAVVSNPIPWSKILIAAGICGFIVYKVAKRKKRKTA